jgi:hypothetical protein
MVLMVEKQFKRSSMEPHLGYLRENTDTKINTFTNFEVSILFVGPIQRISPHEAFALHSEESLDEL